MISSHLLCISHRYRTLCFTDDNYTRNDKKPHGKEKNINWRKFHKLPEAFDIQIYAEAQDMKKQYERENPEQEGLV